MALLHRFACFFALVVVVFGSACSENPEVAKRELVASGDAYFEQGQYAEAIIEYRRAVQLDPLFGLARYKLAEAYDRSDDAENAFGEYVRAADLLPDNIDAQLKAGVYLLFAERYEDAEALARDVLEIEENVEARLLLGNALAGLKDTDGAVAQLEEALEINPRESRLHMGIGSLQLRAGRMAEAEAAFMTAIENAPDSVDAQLSLANFYASTGRAEAARQSLLEADRRNPDDPRINRALGYYALLFGEEVEAEAYFRVAANVSSEPGPTITLADYLVRAGRVPAARELLEPLLTERDPRAYSEVRLRLGSFAFDAGRREEGLALVEEVLERQSRNSRALLLKGRFLNAMDRKDEAFDAARAAAATIDSPSEAHDFLGTLYLERNDVEAAAEAYERAIYISPGMVTAFVNLATLRLNQNQPEEAAELARRALAVAPQFHLARLLLVRTLLRQGDLAGAETELGTLLDSDDELAVAHTLMGNLLLAKGDETAERSFVRALELDPESTEALAGLVSLRLARSRGTEALTLVESRLERQSDDPELLMLAAQIHRNLGDVDRAEVALRSVIEQDAANMTAYALLGQIYIDGGELIEAIAHFDDAAEARPDLTGAQTMAAMLVHRQNRIPEARQRYERILASNPRAAVAANNLAMLQVENGENLDAALALAQVAVQEVPEQPEFTDTLGWIYQKKGFPNLAIQQFEASVSGDPGNPLYHYHLGLANLELGEADKGHASLRRALELGSDFDGADDARRLLAVR